MKLIQLFLVLCPVTCFGATCINEPNDPCLSGNYRTLDEYTRSVAYYDSSSSFSADTTILEGWYRPVSPAGGDMPIYAPVAGYCQSFSPLWLNEPIPSVADGIVKRPVCVVYLGNNCSSTFEICIKNCNSFNVYYLYRPASSYQRYCFGSELPCPSGYTSSNGFTPGCQEIRLDENPVISYDVQTSTVSSTTCQVNTVYNCNVNISNIILHLEVNWSVSGNVVKTENKELSTLPAQLTNAELKSMGVSQYGFLLKCQLTPRLSANGQLTGNATFTEENIEFSAIKSQIQPQEAQDAVPIQGNTNVPIDYTYDCGSQTTVVSGSSGSSTTSVVLDNTCWSCTTNNNCKKRKSSCVINSNCYAEGTTNPTNSKEKCMSGRDEYHWSSDEQSDNLALKIGLGVVGCVSGIFFIGLGIYLYKSHRDGRRKIQSSTVSLNNVHITKAGHGEGATPPPGYSAYDPEYEKRAPTPVESSCYRKNYPF